MGRKKLLTGRLNLFICPKQQKQAKLIAKRHKINLSEYLRRLIAIDILRQARNKIALKLLSEREKEIQINLITPDIDRLEQLKLSGIDSLWINGRYYCARSCVDITQDILTQIENKEPRPVEIEKDDY